MIAYGALDIEIPGHNSQLLFHRAVYGDGLDFAKDWVDQDRAINRQEIPNEATVYQKDQIHLVKLHHADHNNGKCFSLGGWFGRAARLIDAV